MSWYNPLDDLKWVASKTRMGGGGTRAPGARYEYNPNSKIEKIRDGQTVDGSIPTMAPRLSDQTGQPDPWNIDDSMRKRLLAQQAGLSGQFADQGQASYGQLGTRGAGALDYLQGQANGQNSVSAEQLRQGLQQQYANQASMAAGASPQNATMAARTAAIQSGRLGAGLAGQQAVAGLQERQQAQQAYAQLLQGLRGQDLQASLGARQNALSGYGAGAQGQPDKSWLEKNGPAIAAGIAAFSDKRLKKDIKSGEDRARTAAESLGAHLFRYKDDEHGKGQQFGVMTDELKRAGLGHAVISTPAGEMVHGAKLATSTAAMVGSLARRLSKLESAK